MPLSENEQKMLEQMERALSAEDPRFASQMTGTTHTAASRRRIALGLGVVAVGLALVVFGVASATVLFGAIGFAVMVAGVAWAMTPARPSLQAVDGDSTRRPRRPGARPRRGGSLNERMEQRWEQRRREQGL